MKWQGREGSGNVEDRRGMSTGKMAVGGGIGTIVIVILVLLLGGDPSEILNSGGGSVAGTEEYQPSAEEAQLAEFVKVVLKDTETVWGRYFRSQDRPTVCRHWYYSAGRFSRPADMQAHRADHSIAPAMKKYIST